MSRTLQAASATYAGGVFGAVVNSAALLAAVRYRFLHDVGIALGSRFSLPWLWLYVRLAWPGSGHAAHAPLDRATSSHAVCSGVWHRQFFSWYGYFRKNPRCAFSDSVGAPDDVRRTDRQWHMGPDGLNLLKVVRG